jgi:hypothetical protein
MGAIGRRRVEESLSWEVSRRNLLAAYEDLVARPLRRRDDGRRREPLPEPVAQQPPVAAA